MADQENEQHASVPPEASPGVPLEHDDDSGPEKPPPGVRTMAIVRWLLIVLVAVAAVGAWWSYATTGSSASVEPNYQCPMHPQVVSDVPGECPICHMSLEPISKERKGGEPGQAPPADMPPGTTDLELSLDRVQAIGVRTALVQSESGSKTLRATAVVEAPEQNVAEVHVRAEGFVEAIAVRETGVYVKRGQPLLSLYSPMIYQAQAELLATRAWAGEGPETIAKQANARAKLELLGVSSRVADKVLADGKPLRTVSISAPISGYITQKNVVLGSFVMPETVLYQIVDLSKVYIVADIFQQDISHVKVGTVGRFISSTRTGTSTEAKVDLIYPRVDANARTSRVRMQVQNPDMHLVPGEYGVIELGSETTAEVLVIPRDALIDTGEQRYVFIEAEPGHFIPRKVVIGSDLGPGKGIVVREGLEAGDRVVSSATFLIDSESRLRASIASAAQPDAGPAEPVEPPGSAQPESSPPPQQAPPKPRPQAPPPAAAPPTEHRH